MKPALFIFAAIAGLATITANAQSLELPPGTQQSAQTTHPFGSAAIPVGVFANGVLPMATAEGTVTATAWKISSDTLSTLQIMVPLRQQLIDDGFEILVDCETQRCGGFDFRFQINLLPEPEMHIDLGDFRFVSARRGTPDGTLEYFSVIVSRGGNARFVQVTRVGPSEIAAPVIVASSKSAAPDQIAPALPDGTIAVLLTTIGRAPLEDLGFETGSANLADETFPSLTELAEYLNSNPDKSVALVGHTDARGSLAKNMALSKNRAGSVVARLVSEYGVTRQQLEAAGVGYLVPRASNLTADGRTQNRRVEVILTSTR